jgi:hypothetical protein
MRGAIPLLLNTPSWRVAQFKKEAHGQLYFSCTVYIQVFIEYFFLPFVNNTVKTYMEIRRKITLFALIYYYHFFAFPVIFAVVTNFVPLLSYTLKLISETFSSTGDFFQFCRKLFRYL